MVDEFLGCDVVLDDDQAMEDIQNVDDLENFDIDNVALDTNNVVPLDNNVVPSDNVVIEQVEPSTTAPDLGMTLEGPHGASVGPPMVPFDTIDSNATMEAIEEQPQAISPGNQKRRRGRSQSQNLELTLAPSALMDAGAPIINSTPTRPVVIALSASTPSQLANQNSKAIVDEDGFTKVVYRKSPNRKSPKLASQPTILKRLK